MNHHYTKIFFEHSLAFEFQILICFSKKTIISLPRSVKTTFSTFLQNEGLQHSQMTGLNSTNIPNLGFFCHYVDCGF